MVLLIVTMPFIVGRVAVDVAMGTTLDGGYAAAASSLRGTLVVVIVVVEFDWDLKQVHLEG